MFYVYSITSPSQSDQNHEQNYHLIEVLYREKRILYFNLHVTNVRAFSQIDGLKIEDWTQLS